MIVDKDTRSVAFSIGYPIDVTRARPDYAALLLVSSYLGQHRMSSGVLYDRMREKRGLNYGDYAYIEYFPRGMFLMEPQPNLARHQQIFQVWIRPVEPPTAKFALRLALFELDKLNKNGLTQEQFDRTREFLGKYVNVLTRTKRAELGYAIDSLFYGIPPYNDYLKTQLAKLTLADVNRVIKQYIRTDRLVIVAVTRNGEDLKRQLASDDASPMTYNSPKPPQITDEDKLVVKWPLGSEAGEHQGDPGQRGLSVMDLKLVPLEIPEGGNLILGQSHFIKTVEDIYEAIVNTVPQMKFGVAFNEASGPCLTRVDGNDEALKALAAKNAERRRGRAHLRGGDDGRLPDQRARANQGCPRGLFDLLRDGESGPGGGGGKRTGPRRAGRDRWVCAEGRRRRGGCGEAPWLPAYDRI